MRKPERGKPQEANSRAGSDVGSGRESKPKWGISSAGRAPALHAGGQEFESPILHHFKQIELLKTEPSGSFLMLSIHSF